MHSRKAIVHRFPLSDKVKSFEKIDLLPKKPGDKVLKGQKWKERNNICAIIIIFVQYIWDIIWHKTKNDTRYTTILYLELLSEKILKIRNIWMKLISGVTQHWI